MHAEGKVGCFLKSLDRFFLETLLPKLLLLLHFQTNHDVLPPRLFSNV